MTMLFSGRRIIPSEAGLSPGVSSAWGSASTVYVSGGVLLLSGAGRYLVDTESMAASSDVNTINGLSDGEEVMLAPKSGSRTIVFKDSTGNLDIKTDISLNDANDRVRLIRETTNLVVASSRP